MKLIDYYFTDVVANKRVCRWEDKLGRFWMATGAWALFRIGISKPDLIRIEGEQ